MRGELQWIIEGIPEPVAAKEGDIIYAPPKTFHAPEFAGDGLASGLPAARSPRRITSTTLTEADSRLALLYPKAVRSLSRIAGGVARFHVSFTRTMNWPS